MDFNAVGWFEIYVDDLERAKGFYQNVFQVELTHLPNDVKEIEMWAFPMHENAKGVPGALAKMDGVAPGVGGTLVYFSCEDCANELGRVEENGGEVMRPKFPIGEYGFIAIAKDTEGNIIGLHSLQ